MEFKLNLSGLLFFIFYLNGVKNYGGVIIYMIYFVASPFGVTKRTRWTVEERNVIFKEFQEEITNVQLPSSKKIFYVKEKNKHLENRSVAQIKTWIHNYISGKIKRY